MLEGLCFLREVGGEVVPCKSAVGLPLMPSNICRP